MKRKYLFWKILLVITFCMTASLFLLLSRRWYYINYGHGRSADEISAYCELKYKSRGGVRVYNTRARKYTTRKLDWVAFPLKNDSTTVFCLNGKRGYLNIINGKIIIPSQYDRAWQFSEGLGAVLKDNKIGFINIKGDVVIPFEYSYNPDKNAGTDFLFKDGCCTAFGKEGKQGLIDRQGRWTLPPEFDYVFNPVKGYRVIKKDKKYGVIDSLNNSVIPVQYERIKVTPAGFAVLQDSIQQLISFDGKHVIKQCVYDSINELFYHTEATNDDDTFIRCDYSSFEINGRYGLMDKSGNVIIPARFNEIKAISNDVFNCQLGDVRILCNSKGEIVHQELK